MTSRLRWCVGISISVLGALGMGCDRHSSKPHPTASDPSSQSHKPTTQELLTAPRHQLSLQPFAPLSVAVPVSWSVTTMGDGQIVLLTGPTPKETVHINISPRRVMTDDEVTLLETGAKRELASQPDTVKEADFRPLGNGQLFERQTISKPLTLLPGTTDRSPNLRWSFTVFIPHDRKFYSYELSFVGLSMSQYEADKDFLRSIMDTLKIEPDSTNAQP